MSASPILRPSHPLAGRRVPIWDNARWLAIVLVVIGHGILPLIHASDTAYAVYLFIYAFHMPVFVVVSGYFASSAPPGRRQLKRVVTDIVLPYLIFETIWAGVRWLAGAGFWLDFATASWTLWFLLALAAWRIMLPYLALLRYPFLVSVVISVLVGYVGSIDSTFALSRVFGLLPFFVFGYALRRRRITGHWLALQPRVLWRWRAGALAVFVALGVTVVLSIGWLRDVRIRLFLLYDDSYAAAGYDQWWAGAIRLAVMLSALVLVIAFLALMPRHITWFTGLGSATMYIYLLHTFLLYPLRQTPVLQGQQPWWVLPAVIALCIGIALLLSLPVIRRVFRPLIEPRAEWLFRPTSHSGGSR